MTIKKKKMGRPSNRPTPAQLDLLYQNYTAKDIAKLYNVSTATVYSWVARLRAKALETEV